MADFRKEQLMNGSPTVTRKNVIGRFRRKAIFYVLFLCLIGLSVYGSNEIPENAHGIS